MFQAYQHKIKITKKITKPRKRKKHKKIVKILENNPKKNLISEGIETRTMKDEVAAAVIFVTRLVKRNKKLSKDQCDRFSDKLTNILVDRFKNHWHTDKPLKGQAYRFVFLKKIITFQ